MNWIFETYSNVYNTAMMQDVKHAAPAKKQGAVKAAFARLTGRR